MALCEGQFCGFHETGHPVEFSEFFWRVGRPEANVFIVSKDCPTFEREKEYFGEVVAENEFFVAFASPKEESEESYVYLRE